MERVDVLVIGAGPVGALTAALMAQAGVRVMVIEAGEPQILSAPASDGRAIALALSAKRSLDVGGFWTHLSPFAEAILDIQVTDGNAPVLLHYDHRHVGDNPFGWIVENEEIKSAALKRLKELGIAVKSSTIVESWEFTASAAKATLSNGERIEAGLVVAADGRPSPTRQAAGIKIKGWDYGQSAIVCAIGHEKPHNNVAYEHFLPSGPFAILPMTATQTGYRSGIVWTEKRHLGTAIMAQEDAYFLGELSEKVGDFLGQITLAGPRFAYPLTFQMAERTIDSRLALVGDAAHGMHPIAGQGLNLGIRDAAALAQVVVEGARLGQDVGGTAVLERYQRWRRFDTGMMMGVTDGLNHLFSNRNPLLTAARDIGLLAVAHCPPAKRLFSRHAMGVVGDLPRPLQGLPL